MSYQDDLDWLARNAPTKKLNGFLKKDERGEGGILHVGSKPCTPRWNSSDEVINRRAELQNKPSWDGAPEWAEWLAQDADGAWWRYECMPEKCEDGWWSEFVCRPSSAGEVIGSWRDTLEKRPDMNKNSDKIDTSPKRVQKTPESVRNWHESGELPPVGVFVDVTGDVAYGEGEKCCEVIAHVEDCAVIRMSWGLGCFVSRALSPHRTERDELVDIIASNGFLGRDGEACYLIADAIISAGFERNGGKS